MLLVVYWEVVQTQLFASVEGGAGLCGVCQDVWCVSGSGAQLEGHPGGGAGGDGPEDRPVHAGGGEPAGERGVGPVHAVAARCTHTQTHTHTQWAPGL